MDQTILPLINFFEKFFEHKKRAFGGNLYNYKTPGSTICIKP